VVLSETNSIGWACIAYHLLGEMIEWVVKHDVHLFSPQFGLPEKR